MHVLNFAKITLKRPQQANCNFCFIRSFQYMENCDKCDGQSHSIMTYTEINWTSVIMNYTAFKISLQYAENKLESFQRSTLCLSIHQLSFY